MASSVRPVPPPQTSVQPPTASPVWPWGCLPLPATSKEILHPPQKPIFQVKSFEISLPDPVEKSLQEFLCEVETGNLIFIKQIIPEPYNVMEKAGVSLG